VPLEQTLVIPFGGLQRLINSLSRSLRLFGIGTLLLPWIAPLFERCLKRLNAPDQELTALCNCLAVEFGTHGCNRPIGTLNGRLRQLEKGVLVRDGLVCQLETTGPRCISLSVEVPG
jgi:hypothetical protein